MKTETLYELQSKLAATEALNAKLLAALASVVDCYEIENMLSDYVMMQSRQAIAAAHAAMQPCKKRGQHWLQRITEMNNAPQWSKTYCGITHLGDFSTTQPWVTVEDHAKFALLYQWFPGCGFYPTETQHTTAQEAKIAGEIWLKGFQQP